MLSTIKKDLRVVEGRMCIVPKEYPNWYGIEDIGFIWHNEWSDPEIEYDGEVLNSTIVEDTMWEEYLAEGGDENDDVAFGNYMRDNEDFVKELILSALGYDL